MLTVRKASVNSSEEADQKTKASVEARSFVTKICSKRSLKVASFHLASVLAEVLAL